MSTYLSTAFWITQSIGRPSSFCSSSNGLTLTDWAAKDRLRLRIIESTILLVFFFLLVVTKLITRQSDRIDDAIYLSMMFWRGQMESKSTLELFLFCLSVYQGVPVSRMFSSSSYSTVRSSSSRSVLLRLVVVL